MAESFNYIAFGNRDDITGTAGAIAMGRGRMFEYTPTDIGKRLEELKSESIAFLEKLPTFVCSEIRETGDTTSMLVKFGSIENTIVSPKEVSTRFKTVIDFGVIEFTGLQQAKDIFDAKGFQLYRTHWAVKEGNVQEVLNKLAQLKPNLAGTVATQLDRGQETSAEPPPRAKKTLGAARSVEEFLRLLYGLPKTGSVETFFRGHEDATYELTPSLLRKTPDGDWQFMPNEDRLCKELLIAHYDEFQGDQYCFDRLVRMQHYGLPTRLLDISGNPLVALYFACDGKPEQIDVTGEVIVFRVPSENIKYYDSDTVSCLANLSNLTYDQKDDINLTLDSSAFNRTDVAQKLLHHIRSEKGYFDGRIVPDDLGSVVCVKAKRTNTRIKSQSGAFLLFGHEAALPESGNDGIEISRVTIKDKRTILRQLDSININATTVYPSIDRTTAHLRRRYRSARPAE